MQHLPAFYYFLYFYFPGLKKPTVAPSLRILMQIDFIGILNEKRSNYSMTFYWIGWKCSLDFIRNNNKTFKLGETLCLHRPRDQNKPNSNRDNEEFNHRILNWEFNIGYPLRSITITLVVRNRNKPPSREL